MGNLEPRRWLTWSATGKRDQMRFSKVCGVLAALLCAHLVVASTSELPGDPLPNAATPTRLLQVAEGVHKSKEDWRNSIMSDHHGVAAKPVKPQQTSLRKLSIVEHASTNLRVSLDPLNHSRLHIPKTLQQPISKSSTKPPTLNWQLRRQLQGK